jgi:phosphatidate phosphatase APP1
MSIQSYIFKQLRITTKPVVRVYHGYGDSKQLIVYGHVFKISPIARKKFTRSAFTNTFALLRLFFVKPYANATVRLIWLNKEIKVTTENDGFYKLEWDPVQVMSPGWHTIQVDMINDAGEIITSGNGKVHVPYSTQYACISDIDDTFLMSYSSTIYKRLFVLLTENAHSRKPFEGVINHYKYLAYLGTQEKEPNPFFFVSSSEWNLYDYIRDFAAKNELPEGVYLLSQLKRLNEMLKTGKNKHATKLMRIARVLKTYNTHKFILLGDDTQEDPVIYASIIKQFPQQIICVYIRHINKLKQEQTKTVVSNIINSGVECCYFTHSSEAIEHSKKMGLVKA